MTAEWNQSLEARWSSPAAAAAAASIKSSDMAVMDSKLQTLSKFSSFDGARFSVANKTRDQRFLKLGLKIYFFSN